MGVPNRHKLQSSHEISRRARTDAASGQLRSTQGVSHGATGPVPRVEALVCARVVKKGASSFAAANCCLPPLLRLRHAADDRAPAPPPQSTGNASPLRGRSISPLRQRLMANALTAQNGNALSPNHEDSDGMSHWRSPPRGNSPVRSQPSPQTGSTGALKSHDQQVMDGADQGERMDEGMEEEEEEELDHIEVSDLITGFMNNAIDLEERGRRR